MAPSSIPAAQISQTQLRATKPTKRRRKFRSLKEIMRVAKRVVLLENDSDECEGGGGDYYNQVAREQCGSGDRADELLLCDKCDRGYHMLCLRPIVVRIPIGPWFCRDCSKSHNSPLKSIAK